MESMTHREAAAIISESRQRVSLRIHRPFNRAWLDPSRNAYLSTSPRGLVREESSSAVLMDSRPLSIVSSSGELSVIQENEETQTTLPLSSKNMDTPPVDTPTVDMPTVDTPTVDTPHVDTPPVKESDISLTFPVEEDTPELPKEGPPLETSQDDQESTERSILSSSLNDDILSSLSEPQPSPEHKSERVTEVNKSELPHRGSSDKKEDRFTVSLKKGFKGLGFGVDRELSGQKGGTHLYSFVCLRSDLISLFNCTGRGVFVKSVENDPAKSDGRIRPGDEIIQVRYIEIEFQPNRAVKRFKTDS